MVDYIENDLRSLLGNSNRAIEIDEIIPLLLAMLDRIKQLEAAIENKKSGAA